MFGECWGCSHDAFGGDWDVFHMRSRHVQGAFKMLGMCLGHVQGVMQMFKFSNSAAATFAIEPAA